MATTKKKVARKKVTKKRTTPKGGRPRIYTEETGLRIRDLLARGHTVREIAAMDDMPSMSSIFRWLVEEPGFWEHYARGRGVQAEMMADEILEIADDGRNDYMERNGYEVANKEHIGRSRLRVEARLKLMEKLAPKKYGAKLELGGKVALDPISAVLQAIDGTSVGPPSERAGRKAE